MNWQLFSVCLLLLLTQQKTTLAFLTSPDSQESQIHEEFSLLNLEFNELTSIAAQIPQSPSILPICQHSIDSQQILQQSLETYDDHLFLQSHTLSGFEAQLKVKKNYRFQCRRSYSRDEIKHLQTLIDEQYRINIKYDGLAIMEDTKTIGLSIGTKQGANYILNNFLYILLDVFETDQQTLNPTFRVSGFSGHPLSVQTGTINESADFLKDILNMNHKQTIEIKDTNSNLEGALEDDEYLPTEIVFYYQIHVNLQPSTKSKNNNNNNNNNNSTLSNNIPKSNKRINNLNLLHINSLEFLLIQTILAPVILLLISGIILNASYKSYSKQANGIPQRSYEQITANDDQTQIQQQLQSLPQPPYPMTQAILLGFGVSTGIVMICISILSISFKFPFQEVYLAIIVSIHAILASLIGHSHYQSYQGKFLWRFSMLSPLLLTTLAALPFVILELFLHNQITFENQNGEELHLKLALGGGIYLLSTMLGSIIILCKAGNQWEDKQVESYGDQDEEGVSIQGKEMKQISKNNKSQLAAQDKLIQPKGNKLITIKRSLIGSLIVLICFSRPLYLILHNIIHYHMVAIYPCLLLALGLLLVACTSMISAAFTFRDFNGPSQQFDWKSFWVGGSSSGIVLYLAAMFQILGFEKEVNSRGVLYLQQQIMIIAFIMFVVCGGSAAAFSRSLVKKLWEQRDLLNNNGNNHQVSLAQLQKEHEEMRNNISVVDYDEGL